MENINNLKPKIPKIEDEIQEIKLDKIASLRLMNALANPPEPTQKLRELLRN